jgi:two-component system phosphate regulon sensor histidine kinase PhoR
VDHHQQYNTAELVIGNNTETDPEKLRYDFSANVSHELKTPLTVISEYAEILSSGLVKLEDAPEFAAKIYKEVRGFLTLIDDIMLFSHLDEGGGEFKREDVSLLALANEAAERIGPTAEARNIRITEEEEGAVISGVPRILRKVLFNLLDCGVKYNKDNGEVRVSVKRKGKEIGLSAAEQDRVSERFYREDKSRNSQSDGTGLGLAIVKYDTLFHHARIDLQSNGSSVTTITLIVEDSADKL